MHKISTERSVKHVLCSDLELALMVKWYQKLKWDSRTHVEEEENLIRKLKYPWVLTGGEIMGKWVLANIMEYPKKGRSINRRRIQN